MLLLTPARATSHGGELYMEMIMHDVQTWISDQLLRSLDFDIQLRCLKVSTRLLLCACCRVFVGGMPFRYEEDSVREYWSFCGAIDDLALMRFPDTGRFKGMAFITYATDEAYEAALACDGADLDGKMLRVRLPACFSCLLLLFCVASHFDSHYNLLVDSTCLPLLGVSVSRLLSSGCILEPAGGPVQGAARRQGRAAGTSKGPRCCRATEGAPLEDRVHLASDIDCKLLLFFASA